MQVARSGCAFSASGFRQMNFLPSAAVATVFCCINFQLKSRARTHPSTLPVLYSACTLLPRLSVTRPLLFTRPPDRLGRGSHFEAPAHTSCMTLAMLLYLACSDLAGDLLGSPKMPASGALEYREYHVNQLAWAKTTACQSSALLSSALLSYIFCSPLPLPPRPSSIPWYTHPSLLPTSISISNHLPLPTVLP